MPGDPIRYILLYDELNTDPDVRINHESNLFLPGIGVYTFIDNLREVLKYVKPDLPLEPAYPDWIINSETDKELIDVITWNVDLQPAKLGGTPKPGSATGTREIKARLRTEVQSSNKSYQVFGQMFDAFFHFTLWSQTAAKVEQNAEWFQFSFMPHYGNLLGSDQYWFHERKQDKELLKINNLLQTRTLTYYVKLAVNSAVETEKIQEIKLKLDS